MNRYDIKHKLGKHIPVSITNAVLDRFTVEQDEGRVIIRISYYHLKALNTINFQVMLLEHELAHENLLKDMAKLMVAKLRAAAKEAKPLQHIKVTLTVQND